MISSYSTANFHLSFPVNIFANLCTILGESRMIISMRNSKGSFINYVNRILGIFDPSPPSPSLLSFVNLTFAIPVPSTLLVIRSL